MTNQNTPTPLLSDDEIRRRLQAIRFSPADVRYARKSPSINGIAAQAGVTRQTVYKASTVGPTSDYTRQRLSQALTCKSGT